jgi:hypothetical protein
LCIILATAGKPWRFRRTCDVTCLIDIGWSYGYRVRSRPTGRADDGDQSADRKQPLRQSSVWRGAVQRTHRRKPPRVRIAGDAPARSNVREAIARTQWRIPTWGIITRHSRPMPGDFVPRGKGPFWPSEARGRPTHRTFMPRGYAAPSASARRSQPDPCALSAHEAVHFTASSNLGARTRRPAEKHRLENAPK